MKKIIFLFSAFLLAFSLNACQETTTLNKDKPIILVSIVPEADFVRQVAGDLVEVVTVIPPGYSPATYEPTPQTMVTLAEADIYFTIGVAAEDTAILPSLVGPAIVSLEDFVASIYPDRSFDLDDRDPHIWLSIKRVVVMVNTIASVLADFDPDNASAYEDNAEAYVGLLNSLDNLLALSFSGITNNKFIVYHPAYGYFADDYGLDMISIEDEGKEATTAWLAEVVSIAEANDIHTVFYQAEIDSSQVTSFAEEIEGVAVELDPLASDYVANMIEMAALIRGAVN
ncbi:MAG TPA: zinc ABC transporter substrate-binding protein [Bacillota bacterium]|nr:zinc ABC transporter substrate-binding protein [Bacillota bacterium]HPJ85837.1 zinc ABC transporter substrate-binding protein [Bacillota bacterium]HPQ62150.1 zinc ABC transporter substrate-binding protein [Bacillota bacterium]HRX91895.1 zinc ABC transporter substrate-binding protein [Candidatus Izemoplasmatales bacterium]